MKNPGAALTAHVAQQTTALVFCWSITRRDALQFGFTSNVERLEIDGLAYEAAAGFTPGAVENSDALSVDDMSVDGLIDSPTLTEADLIAGVWDHARVEVFLVNAEDPAAGKVKMRAGWLGQVQTSIGGFRAEVRGLVQRMQQTIGRSITAACDADFGDTRCAVALAGHTVAGAVTAVTSRRIFDADTLPTAAGGLLTWLTGANAGRQIEIRSAAAGAITLALPMPADIAIGDTYSAVAGCDKSRATCRDTYSNINRFRGFPDLPTTNEMIRGAV